MSVDEYERLMEDIADLSAIASRMKEKTVSWAQVKRRLRRDGRVRPRYGPWPSEKTTKDSFRRHGPFRDGIMHFEIRCRYVEGQTWRMCRFSSSRQHLLNLRVFEEDKYCDILINNIRHYQQQYQFVVLGYVIMPTHFHWIVEVNRSTGTISDIIRDIKKYTAWDILALLKQEGRREFDALFTSEAAPYRDQNRKVWMRRFHDEAIRNEEMFLSRLHYMHKQPG